MNTDSFLRVGLVAATLAGLALPASAVDTVRTAVGHHGTIISRTLLVSDFAAGKLRIAKMDTGTQSDAMPLNYGPRALLGAGVNLQIGRGVGR